MDDQSVVSVEDENEGVYSIDVAVRVRPLNHMELASGEVDCVRVLDSGIVVVLDPTKMDRGQEDDYLRQHRSREKRYTFDHAFGETASQNDVYAATTEKLLSGIMDGFNASCFAYGATGAGKTHTMLGNTDQPGCMVLTVGELFKRLTSHDNKVYRVCLTYLEVYNENIRDLLNPATGNLDLREDPVKGICVAGITEFTTSTVEETMQLLHRGNLNRSVEPTKKNETSSRSHAVMQIMVEGRDKAVGLNEVVRVGKLSMVDLAGSERASATDNRGARLVEGANINRSLLALANCINALASESEAAARAGRNGRRRLRANFVPYRDSKLTRLLKDSFGGNCRTVMITNVSPAGNQYEETVNSLKYANRAKDIKTKVVQNVVEMDQHVVQYQSIIRELRQQVDQLRGQLAANAGAPTVFPSIGGALTRPPAQAFAAASPPPPEAGDVDDDVESVQVLQHKGLHRSKGGGGAERGKEQLSTEAGQMATRAKNVFKDRARLLRKLIDMEESIYSLKIDLAVVGVKRRRAEACATDDSEKEVEDAQATVAALTSQVTVKERSVAELLVHLRENDEATRDLQHVMKRKVQQAGQLERLAMHVRNHILEVQNIELQLRERAKENLSERILTEVARDTEVKGWLPKIEIAKRPASADRQLFTPSSKAPGAAVRQSGKLANGAQLTSSRVFQLGSRIGSLAWELDEGDTTVPANTAGEHLGPGSRPHSAPTHSPTMTPAQKARRPAFGDVDKVRASGASDVADDLEAVDVVDAGEGDALYAEASSLEPGIVSAPRQRPQRQHGAARDRGGPALIMDGQHDAYKQRLKQRQRMMSNQRASGADMHRRATPERELRGAHRRPSPDKGAGNGGGGYDHGAGGNGSDERADRPVHRRVSAEGLSDKDQRALGDKHHRDTSDKQRDGSDKVSSERRKHSMARQYGGRAWADRAGGGAVRRPSGDKDQVNDGAPGRDARDARDARDPGLNLDKTEVRAVMKPLQAESQVDRLMELQERYNLGKMNAAQKRRSKQVPPVHSLSASSTVPFSKVRVVSRESCLGVSSLVQLVTLLPRTKPLVIRC